MCQSDEMKVFMAEMKREMDNLSEAVNKLGLSILGEAYYLLNEEVDKSPQVSDFVKRLLANHQEDEPAHWLVGEILAAIEADDDDFEPDEPEPDLPVVEL